MTNEMKLEEACRLLRRLHDDDYYDIELFRRNGYIKIELSWCYDCEYQVRKALPKVLKKLMKQLRDFDFKYSYKQFSQIMNGVNENNLAYRALIFIKINH